MNIDRSRHNVYKTNKDWNAEISATDSIASTSGLTTTSGSGSTIIISGGGSGLTSELLKKLNSIEEGAQVNLDAFSYIKLNDGTKDTLIEAAKTLDRADINFKGIGVNVDIESTEKLDTTDVASTGTSKGVYSFKYDVHLSSTEGGSPKWLLEIIYKNGDRIKPSDITNIYLINDTTVVYNKPLTDSSITYTVNENSELETITILKDGLYFKQVQFVNENTGQPQYLVVCLFKVAIRRTPTITILSANEFWKLDENGNLYTTYNTYSTKELSAYGLGPGEEPTGALYLHELKDVDTTDILDQGLLQYNLSIGKWVVTDGSSIRPDLTGYATELWVNNTLGSYATKTYVSSEISKLVDSAPETLDTLYELAAALGNDPNFSTTVLNLIGTNTLNIETNRINIASNVNEINNLKYITSIFQDMFEWDKSESTTDSTKWKIKAKATFYSVGEVSAYGVGEGLEPIGALYLYGLKDVNGGSNTLPTSADTLLMWNGTTWEYVSKDLVGLNTTELEQYLTNNSYAKKSDITWNNLSNKPSWIGSSKPSYSWSEINDKPGWIGSTKPTYTYSEVGAAPLIHYHDWSDITTGKPTTLSGYGITDAYTKHEINKTVYSKSECDEFFVNKSGDTMTGDLNVRGYLFGGNETFLARPEYAFFGKDYGIYFYYLIGNTLQVSTHNNRLYQTNSFDIYIDSGVVNFRNDPLVEGHNVLHLGNYSGELDSRYVLKSGDTMTGDLLFSAGKGIASSTGTLEVGKYSGTIYLQGNGLYYSPSSGTNYTVWHAGNDGSGSGLDADMLDGRNASNSNGSIPYLVNYPSWDSFGNESSTDNQVYYKNILKWAYANENHGGKTLLIGVGNPNSLGNLQVQLYGTDSVNNEGMPKYSSGIYIPVGGLPTVFGTYNYSYYEHYIASTNSNVASATKLQTPRTIWGQSFDGTSNISGWLSGATTIECSTGVRSRTICIETESDGTAGSRGSEINCFISPLYLQYATTNNIVMCNGGGNVVIGMVTPDYRLHVNGDIGANGLIYSVSNGIGSNFGALNSSYCHMMTTAPSFYFQKEIVINGECLSYVDGGYSLGNRSSKWGDVHIIGWYRSYADAGWYNEKHGGGIYMTDSTYVRVYNGKSFYVPGNIVAEGEVTAFSTSDIRLKTNFKELKAIEYLRNLTTYEYDWTDEALLLKADKTKHGYGLIALEVLKYIPEVVTSNMFSKGYLGIDYTKLVPFAISAIKEVDNEVTALKKRVKYLEDKLKLVYNQ